MKITLDIKSVIIGLLSAGIIFSTISFKDRHEADGGKFRTVIGEKGIVILDSETGAYIIAPEVMNIGKMQWVKGDFYETHKVSIDNKKLPK